MKRDVNATERERERERERESSNLNQQEEILDVLNENGTKTGQTLPRSEIHRQGLWHRAIVVAIVNENKEILMQQRSHNKDKNADMWDLSVAGHISSGQDSLLAAVREIKEELGYNITTKDLRYMVSFKDERNIRGDFIERQFYDFFILRKDILDITKIKMQESEVQQVKLVNITELTDMINQNIVVQRMTVYQELISYLFRI